MSMSLLTVLDSNFYRLMWIGQMRLEKEHPMVLYYKVLMRVILLLHLMIFIESEWMQKLKPMKY
ncbi:hypothetical protein D3C86_1888140 [compost metagenome]